MYEDNSHIRNQVCFIAALILLLWVPSIYAQVELDDQDTISYSIDLDDMVITGQLAPTHYKKASHKVAVISQEEISQKGHTQLQEVLTSLPNVRVSYDPILGTSITMRGVASDNVNIMIDGVPVVGRLDGALDISQINLQDIKRIEIIEGPLSVLYGNNAAGGVINIITMGRSTQEVKLDLDAQYEAPGIHNYGINLDLSKNKLFFKIGANYFKHQLYPLDSTRVFEQLPLENGDNYLIKKYPFNPKERVNFHTQAGIQLNEDRRLIFKWNESEEEVLNLGQILRPTFKPYARDNQYVTRRSDQSISYKDVIAENYYMNVTLAKNKFIRNSFFNWLLLDSDSINESLSTIDTFDYAAYFGKIDFSSNKLSWLNFLTGITYNREEASGERIFDPVDKDFVVDLSEIAGFGSIKYYPVSKLSVNVSGRYAWNSNYNTPFVPAVQILWEASDDFNFRLGYAHGFRAPSLKELYLNFVDLTHNVKGNTDLVPESSVDYSMSMTYQKEILGLRTKIDLQAYHNSIEQKIVLVQLPQDPNTILPAFEYNNIDQFTSYGLNYGFDIGKNKWRFKSSGGLGFRDNNLEAIDTVATVIDFQNELNYKLPYGIQSTLVHRYFGATPKFQLQGEDVVENEISAYQLIDLTFSKSFMSNDALRLGLGVKNVLDYKRADIAGNVLNTGMHTTSSPVQIVSQGRTVFVKLGYSFGR